jgi:excisionase family DNA binding protein
MPEQIPNEEGWWDIRRAAEYLGMSTAFVRKCVQQRTIPFVRMGNKTLRFRKAALDAWAEAHGNGGETGGDKNR